MITFEEARSLIRNSVVPLASETLSLSSAAGRFLAETVYSASDSPRFDNSAVDGYAMGYEAGQRSFQVVGEVAAGQHFERQLRRGECVRIFTGAKMPAGADTCLMQEHCSQSAETITHTDTGLKRGANVRSRAEELKKGDFLLEKGAQLTAQAIGLLASCGIEEVRVSKQPHIHLVITGSEFTTAAENEQGKIFNSNGPMLQAAITGMGLGCTMQQVADDKEALHAAMEEALRRNDLIITTGGVSVGDYDHVPATCHALHLECVFHKVAQKPGKPMYFGMRGGRYVLGLPGNPRAVMIGFWLHTVPLLRSLQGASVPYLPSTELPLGEAIKQRGSRTELLAVELRNGQVFVAKAQNSHMLGSLVGAAGIAVVPGDSAEIAAGTKLRVYHFCP